MPLVPYLQKFLAKKDFNQDEIEIMRLLLARYTSNIASELQHDSSLLQTLMDAIDRSGRLKDNTSIQELAIQQVSF